MADSTILPGVRAALIARDGTTSPEFYRFFRALSVTASLPARVDDLTVRVAALEAGHGTIGNVVGKQSIISQGVLSNGLVVVQLDGDVDVASPTNYYGSDTAGAKGWHAISDALDDSTNIVKSVDTDGVSSFDLVDLPSSATGTLQAVTVDPKGRVSGYRDATITGTDGNITVAHGDASDGLPTVDLADVTVTAGGTIQRLAFDAKGRLSEQDSATTDDLIEGSANLYYTNSRATSAHQSYRSLLALTVPIEMGRILTPSVDPYGRSDTTNAAAGFDNSWLIVGEDGQHHVVSKMDMTTYRADREPNWTQASPWNVQMSTKITGWSSTLDSPNSFMRAIAQESWTYLDNPGIGMNITTGYCISVGSGDLNGSVYRPPFVTFWREGTAAAQSLTAMLDAAGIMGGDYTSPRCLNDVSRTAADTFYLAGLGVNQSTNPTPSRATFGKMVLTLNGSKTQTSPTAVSSLTYADYLSVLQSAMPAGETITNVTAIADKLVGTILHVLVTTKDASLVERARMVLFDDSAHTATLDALPNKLTGGAVWPLTPQSGTTKNAGIAVGSAGILFVVVGASQSYVFFRGTAETAWRNVVNQANRALGAQGVAYIQWDATRSRFVVTGGNWAGWMDSLCKQGHPFTEAIPRPPRWPSDIARVTYPGFADAAGTLIVGLRQQAILIPSNLPSPTKVLWGLRVAPTATNDQVAVSEGEAVIYQYNAAPKRVYFAGGTLGGLTSVGSVYTVVLTGTALVQRPGNGLAAGTDYPEPALFNQIILANVTRTATGVPITTTEIDQATYRDQ